MPLPSTPNTTIQTSRATIPSDGGKQRTSAGVAPRLLQVQYVQHVRTQTAATNGGRTHETHGRPQCRASRPPHPNPCSAPLARRGEGWPQPGCSTWRPRARTSRRTCNMVPSHGDMCKEERQTLSHR